MTFAVGRRAVLTGMIATVACSAADEARVSVQYVPRAEIATLTPAIVVSTAGMRRTLSIGELGAAGGQPIDVATPTTGRLDVEFALDDRGAVVSAGTVHVDLRPDWAWGFRVSIDSVSPLRGCFGCAGAEPFPLGAAYRRGAADSVWISWGGNGIKHPVVY
jgi:hypothetical protein